MNTTPSGKDPSSSGEKRKKQEKLLYPCRDFRKNTERICLWGALCPAGVTLFREIASGGFFQAGLLRLILAWCLIELVIFLLLKLLFVMQDSKSIREILEWLQEDASPGRVRQAWKYLSETKGAHLCPPVFDEPVTRILTGRIMLSSLRSASSAPPSKTREKNSFPPSAVPCRNWCGTTTCMPIRQVRSGEFIASCIPEG